LRARQARGQAIGHSGNWSLVYGDRQLVTVRGQALLPDDLGADRLPAYSKSPNKITDGHLLELARRHGAMLVTLDAGIPGALLIPVS
jgi:hypothetical protein